MKLPTILVPAPVHTVTVHTDGVCDQPNTADLIERGSVSQTREEPPLPVPDRYKSGDEMWTTIARDRGYRWNPKTDKWVLVFQVGDDKSRGRAV